MGAKTSQQMLDAARHMITQHLAGNHITVYACCKQYDVTRQGLINHLRKIGREDLIMQRSLPNNVSNDF